MALSCARGGSDWILGKNSSQKEGDILEQAAQGVVESLSLEMIRSCVDVALRDVGSGHDGDGLGLDLVISVVCSTIMIL